MQDLTEKLHGLQVIITMLGSKSEKLISILSTAHKKSLFTLILRF